MSDAMVISASDAAARGMNLYFTGAPCPHGHVAPRKVNNRDCCECARLRRKDPRPRVFDRHGVVGQEIRQPHDRWPDNGRVDVVTDPNWLINGKPRVVRRVGWRACMCCTKRFFSWDMTKVRMCDDCKGTRVDKTAYGFD